MFPTNRVKLTMKRRIISLTVIFSTIMFILISTVLSAQVEVNNPKSGKLRVASCQFPVSSNIAENLQWIEKQMIEAKLKKADIIHFPECALSGYAGIDMKSLEGFNWNELHRATDSVLTLAKKLKLWVVLGSMHKLSGNNKPHNSLYLINSKGEVVDRYDKRFCTDGDLEFFTPGDHFVTFNLNGIECGLLICFDLRFPELYREYRKLGADLIFQSFHNARQGKGSIHPVIMHLTAQAHAGINHFYMSLTNSSSPESWPCYFITPDGLVKNKHALNVPGALISDIDITDKYYDASKSFRMEAINGKLNSGETVKDPLSADRKKIY